MDPIGWEYYIRNESSNLKAQRQLYQIKSTSSDAVSSHIDPLFPIRARLQPVQPHSVSYLLLSPTNLLQLMLVGVGGRVVCLVIIS